MRSHEALDVPAVLKNRSKLIEYPSKCVYSEAYFEYGNTPCFSLGHERKIERQKNDKLNDFQYVSRSRYDQAVLIQQRRIPGVIQRYRLLLVTVRDEIQKAGRAVDNPSLVDGVHAILRSASCSQIRNFACSDHLHFLA